MKWVLFIFFFFFVFIGKPQTNFTDLQPPTESKCVDAAIVKSMKAIWLNIICTDYWP